MGNQALEGVTRMSDQKKGWYCPKCDAIYFDPEADDEHLDWHEGVNVTMQHRETAE